MYATPQPRRLVSCTDASLSSAEPRRGGTPGVRCPTSLRVEWTEDVAAARTSPARPGIGSTVDRTVPCQVFDERESPGPERTDLRVHQSRLSQEHRRLRAHARQTGATGLHADG